MVDNTGTRTSQVIKDISQEISSDGITFREFLEFMGNSGILMASVILVAPFLLPVSIPGSSLPFGLAILLINLRSLIGGRVLLPDFILNHRISYEHTTRILNGMQNILSRMERFINPRVMVLCNHSYIKNLNSFLIILSAFWLMLPLPVPLTDFLPGYSILFLTLGSLEKDGYLIIVGYILTAVTTFYFILIALLGFEIVNYILMHLGINFRI